MSRLKNLPVGAIAVIIVVAIANFGNTIVAPVLPSIQNYFGSSTAETALMVSCFGFGRLAMDLPAGFLTDRVSPSRLFAAGILLSGVAAALAAFSTNLQQLLIFRTAMGFGSAIMSTSALVVLVNSTKPDQRGKALALYTSAMLSGSAISPTIGGYLAALFSWRAVFVFCALTPLITFPLNLLFTTHTASVRSDTPVHSNHATKVKDSQNPNPVGRVRVIWPALIVVYFATFLSFFNRQGMLAALLPLYGGLVLNMDPTSIGGVLSSRAIFTIIITLPAGALADRIGRKQLLIPGLLMGVIGNLFLLSGESLAIFTISTFLVSLAVVANNMLSALVAELIPESLLGRGMGLYRFTCDLGTVLGPFTLGLIVDRSGFPTAAATAAGILVVGVIACMLLVPRQTSPKPAQ